MEAKKDRRRSPRNILDPPEVGLLFYEGEGKDGQNYKAVYVDLYNRSNEGILVKTNLDKALKGRVYLQAYDAWVKAWVFLEGEVRWTKPDTEKPGFCDLGVALHESKDMAMIPWKEILSTYGMPFPSDYEFFRRTRMLKFISRDAVCPLLNSITRVVVKPGERIIVQGEQGNSFYVIQEGTCSVKIEKSGGITPICRRGEGDILGEMSLLTGEPTSAHVDAETEMVLWLLTKDQFEDIAEEFPDFKVFLTDIVSERFVSSKETADRKIGKYIITDIIGRGGYSVVYRGVHSELNMPVCIKMLKHDLAMDPDFHGNFKNEARLIASFDHPNIIRVYDIEERFRTIFIIMEYLEGVPLSSTLKECGRLPYRQIVSILIQVCQGLDYAHSRGIVHQDIKPANIFILPNDQVKILDFGVAAPAGSEIFDFVGTVFYMAPEQINSDPIDARTDIYALGITAYEMAVGKRPFPEDNFGALMQMHVDEEIPDPGELVGDIPPQLRQFIIRACRRVPSERYKNICEALEELKSLAEDIGLDRAKMFKERRMMTTLNLIYGDSVQPRLNKLLEEFSEEVRHLGVTVKAAEFKDI